MATRIMLTLDDLEDKLAQAADAKLLRQLDDMLRDGYSEHDVCERLEQGMQENRKSLEWTLQALFQELLPEQDLPKVEASVKAIRKTMADEMRELTTKAKRSGRVA